MLTRRFRRRPSLAALAGLALLAVIGARTLYLYSFPSPETQPVGPLLEGSVHVVEVIDGRTLLVRQVREATAGSAVSTCIAPVRLLGMDSSTPGAMEFLSQHALGKEVELKFDKRRLDRDRRFLAYVYLGEALLNERLIEAGLARAKDYPGDSATISKRLRGAESRAKAAGRGLWSSGNLVTTASDR